MEYYYETVTYSDKYPAKILLQNKPQRRCNTGIHWHKCLEMLYIVDGTLGLREDEKKYIGKTGDTILFNSENMHSTFEITAEENIEYLVMLISLDYIKKYYKNIDAIEFDIEKNDETYSKLRNVCMEMYQIFKNKEGLFELRIFEKLLEIYDILLSECVIDKHNNEDASEDNNFYYAKKAIEYIGIHYNEKITLAKVADYVGLSKSYFARYFKQVTKMTFIQYLNRLRLEHGLNDIINENKTVTQAAYDNGFADVKAFIEICKKKFNCTPGQYAKTN